VLKRRHYRVGARLCTVFLYTALAAPLQARHFIPPMETLRFLLLPSSLGGAKRRTEDPGTGILIINRNLNAITLSPCSNHPQPSVIANVVKQSRTTNKQCFAFVCNKAVCGSSMWHVLWGVPSRMTVKGESAPFRERNVKWIAASLRRCLSSSQ
jgi:hypothetical protein